MTTLQVLSDAQVSKEVVVNENNDTLSAVGIFGKRHPATSGLTWGYYGGYYDSTLIANGTVALTASLANYVVVHRTTGVVSNSTATTNWDDTATYGRLYKVTTNASAVIEPPEDHRFGSSGIIGAAAPGAAVAAADITVADAGGYFGSPSQAEAVLQEIGAFMAGAGGGSVTSVDASGGVETVAGTPITSTGTIRGATAVNAQTGTTYTYLSGDRGKLVSHTNAAAIAGTLPVAGGTFPANWYMWVQNRGAGTLTITPTTSTIDGAATLVLTTGQGALIVSDGTNYFTMRGVGSAAGGSVATDAVWDATGDMVQGTGANTAARTPLGTAAQVWTVNAGETAAEWAAAAGGGSGTKTLAFWSPAMIGYPHATAFTTLDTRNSHPLQDASDSADESFYLDGVIPQGADLTSGATVRAWIAATSATTGDAYVGAAFENISGLDIDSDSFDSEVVDNLTVSGTSGIALPLTLTFTAGDLDGLAAGDPYRLQIKVHGSDAGNHTVVGDVEIRMVDLQQVA